MAERGLALLKMKVISFRRVEYGSAEYADTVDLRVRILWQPIGLKFEPEKLKSEGSDYHLACYQGEQLIGCLVLTACGSAEVRMRQVSIAQQLQRQGVGRALVGFSEMFAVKNGFHKIVLHARESVIGFYEKLGYVRVGERFEEAALPHWKMEKGLKQNSSASEINQAS